jgi:hypothetical protein
MAYAALQKIEHNEPITGSTHPEFRYHLQHALLLVLLEQGMISFTACRRAEDLLYRQYHGERKP